MDIAKYIGETTEYMILAWQESHRGIEVNFVENDDAQCDTQGGTQGDELDEWIEYQVAFFIDIVMNRIFEASNLNIADVKPKKGLA